MSDLPDVDVDQLISVVQSKPVLWDKSCEKYKDKFKTLEAWKDVSVDSYQKSISKTNDKSGAGASKAKAYIYASQLQFLNQIFKERETEDTLSQNIDDNDGGVADVIVENDETPIQWILPNRHLSFFKGLLPSLDDFDEYDTLDFQMEVLQVVKKIRQWKHPLPSTFGTPYASLSRIPPMTSSSDTPPMVPNQYIQSQPNLQHVTSAYLKSIHSQVSAVQF
ncbi:uncharacterized protein LOC124606098 [Schistocerca americana]|uniref:uncharacterized protein LOC124606098 n=1 Tax=Schistocerca americana TaxID=7009 RepID=UPI001F4FDE2D|nr:uncharacterized protein LOC124606098 [Schistocerca americana]